MNALMFALGCTVEAPPPADPPPPVVEAPPAPTVADGPNAKLPPGSALHFEARAVDDRIEHLAGNLAVPVGWTPDDSFQLWFSPPKEPDLGFGTKLQVGTSCGGGCSPKDWKAVIDAQMHEAVPDDGLIKDEALPNNGRIRWGATKDHAAVYAAWWEEGTSEYRDCTVYLGSAELIPALDAFVEACRSAELAKP